MKMKKTLLAGIAALLLATGAAHAADMRIEKAIDNNELLVFIEGEIVSGDYRKFKKMTDRLPYGTEVRMFSPGGLLVEGLNIGTTIRAKGFRTFAPRYCMSVCAMMWLAGWERSATSDTSIGFHGTSYENGESSIAGNAVAGAYLANLGYSYKVIAALIKVGPKDIDFLSFEWAKTLGIKVLTRSRCDEGCE
jgi:hypothetical protein